ncbi:MAG: hypothetical protein GY913_14125 [Proteobacteria bacterium]|nr:hypothetical protein [Pseudomonadota bacterium]MCP4918046.1 hypothetical protein [Pseudomonadota bacterium]
MHSSHVVAPAGVSGAAAGQTLGGAWLPELDTCTDTCEEQVEGVLCVESAVRSPMDAYRSPGDPPYTGS